MAIITRRLRDVNTEITRREAVLVVGTLLQRGTHVMQRGTHAMGGAAGTISFAQAFSGTPTLSLQLVQGTSNFGEIQPLRTPSIFSGSFTYAGSGGQAGTFQWSALGP